MLGSFSILLDSQFLIIRGITSGMRIFGSRTKKVIVDENMIFEYR